MLARRALVFMLLSLCTAPARAGSMQMRPMMSMMHGGMAVSQAMPCGHGVIVKINATVGRITIRHGHLENLDMPAMTTAFRVRDRSLIKGFKAGDRVRFQSELDDDALVITQLSLDR